MKRNEHNKSVGSVIERSDDRINATSEVFTPMDVCARMINDIPDDIKKNPNSTFLDNSAGSGNFLVTLKNILCLLYTSPSPRDYAASRMPSSA